MPTLEDEIDEQSETFNLDLSNPGGATIQDGTATGTITDDDEQPLILITDTETDEGEIAEFTVTLSAVTSRTVTGDYATAGGTAEEGADYTRTSGTLTFAPGEDAKTIPVPTLEDEIDEESETFTSTSATPTARPSRTAPPPAPSTTTTSRLSSSSPTPRRRRASPSSSPSP